LSVVTFIDRSPTIRTCRYCGDIDPVSLGWSEHHRDTAAAAPGASKPFGYAGVGPEGQLMRSPSIVHFGRFDADVYLVLDDFGRLGRAYREN
jgi:hypothetical protein